ncbi:MULTISPECIES: hypothetical protein [unclassified Streptomyces]|uniref:hypothetical protein n=1 Tax=unclassified Streptomyces TaxID=2593676 RepID=UPI0037FCA115
MGEAGAWRPLSERTVAALTQALNSSVFPAALQILGHGSFSSSTGFRQHGYNRSRTARLVYRALSNGSVPHPVEAVVTVALPEVYGTSTAATATLTINVISRVCRYVDALDKVGVPGEEYRYPVPNLLDLLEGILKTTVDPRVVAEIARITDIDPALVAQPRELHLVADRQVKELLRPDLLQEIPDAGASAGGIFRANPALDLRDIADRQEQVDDWIRQLGLDAGLTGMEALVESYRASTRPRP